MFQGQNKPESESWRRHVVFNSHLPTLLGHATIPLKSDVNDLELAQILQAKGKVLIIELPELSIRSLSPITRSSPQMSESPGVHPHF